MASPAGLDVREMGRPDRKLLGSLCGAPTRWTEPGGGSQATAHQAEEYAPLAGMRRRIGVTRV